MKPDGELVPWPIWNLPSLPGAKNQIMMKRDRPFCWIAKIGSIGVMLPHTGTTEQYKEVMELPEHITLNGKGRISWRPEKFGRRLTRDLSFGKDSGYVGQDFFGMIHAPKGEYEQQFVVVNQQGLICSFLPIRATRPVAGFSNGE